MLEPRLRDQMKHATERLARAQQIIEDMERGREIGQRRAAADFVAAGVGAIIGIAGTILVVGLMLAR